uniref:putative tRNA pseudouridine synthase Pus10 isoform X1 n=1 Tax=Podarcis muralis TaxID=64176 RepID=UPI00109F5D65|nr:putative tRNA pseudouridine synthase Pus10 isoform X1 [Podarcis muralis]XP_028580996.1 putative tRNA pseudouridine synthase Pus10 isoform X1 [Podarcis muralis]XP_028580999.1 putative tRNA pseudouridine synthase Pus10 isoform X1 [Podarcis muralis]XP_028581000.1 putative tRNA pseudouridine synthase Pus10 isoform X1 [Podarcis muralis]
MSTSTTALSEKDKSIAQKLLNFGACPRCIFRFCRIGSQDLYRRPYKELLSEVHEFLENTTEENKLPCETANPPHKRIKLDSVKEGEEQTSNGSHQVPNAENDRTAGGDENLRPAVCSICLGILQELCEMDFVKAVCHKINSSEYQFTSFVFSVSFPPQLSVREHAAWLLVKEEMEKQDFLAEKEDLVQLKEAYKWIIHPLFLEQLGVPADGKSLFEVSVVFAHPETDEDCHFLASACPSCFKQEKNKQSVFTRMAVVKALDMISEEDFLKHFQCPLTSPKVPCTAVDIQCTNGAIFVAGRYNKYSRTLPQTPWIIDGERKMESSVEELISEHLMAAFKADSFNFSSSGREDVDVRTLGKGRPFAIELVNPRKVRLAAEEMKELQQIINNSSDKVQVRDLQLVTREAIGHMKEGEEAKTKTYSALIWTEKAIRNEDIELLDNMKELKLDQKTPLRVLHRRPLAVRVRVIYTMQSEYIDEHHFRLHLKTQAGTYIKEFVHGDFGRTKPNIGTLLGTTADILELDVESVDVDWPPALDDK